MKVKDLIEKLQTCDPDAIVVLSRDSEGNGYSTAHKIEKKVFIPKYGEVHYQELTPELIEQGWEQEDMYVPDDCVVVHDAVVIEP